MMKHAHAGLEAVPLTSLPRNRSVADGQRNATSSQPTTEARRGWQYQMAGLAASLGGIWLWSQFPALPLMVVTVLTFGAIIPMALGMAFSIQAWRQAKGSPHLMRHAIAGSVIGVSIVAGLLWLVCHIGLVHCLRCFE
ncbi:MAG: hypothetical protein KDM63_07555 [Verrucomicrobiae bacterium]|nr:hypothetical protein [Verrucomicrobiae bacterium]